MLLTNTGKVGVTPAISGMVRLFQFSNISTYPQASVTKGSRNRGSAVLKLQLYSSGGKKK